MPTAVKLDESTTALVLLIGGAAFAYIVADHLTTPYDAEFEKASRTYGVPSNLLRAVARVESNFKPGAISPTGDVGLMQINVVTGARYGRDRTALLNPSVSIDLAARYLKELRGNLGTRFSPFTWPAAYNVGPDLNPKDVGIAYASRVLYHWQLYDFGRVLA